MVSLTGTLSPTSLISSLQKCLKRIREYFIYIFMQRADLWLERLYMWWIVEGFVRIRHFSGTHFHLRSRLFGRREDGFIFKFNVWLYGCNTYLHYLPFALYDEGKLFSKNTIPTTSQKLPDSRGDVFKRVVLSGPAVWTLQICNLISYKKKERERKAANLPDVSRERFPFLFDKLALLTEDVLTCHSRKRTAMNNKFSGLIFVFW